MALQAAAQTAESSNANSNSIVVIDSNSNSNSSSETRPCAERMIVAVATRARGAAMIRRNGAAESNSPLL